MAEVAGDVGDEDSDDCDYDNVDPSDACQEVTDLVIQLKSVATSVRKPVAFLLFGH